MRMKWRVTGTVGAVALGLFVFATAGLHHRASSAASVELPLPVRVAEIHLISADETVRYAAVIRPRIEADIGFRVPGKVTQRLVEVGQRVSTGEPLARLDPADLELQARAAEAQLVSAQADSTNTTADFQRYSHLQQGQWTTQQEFDKRKAAMETAAAKVRELEATLKVARNNAQYATLVADGDGVVTSVMVQPGQVVAQGQAVFRIARLGEMEAVANVPEQQVAHLWKAGMTAELWAMPGMSIGGRLREVSPSADANTRTFEAKVTLIDPPPEVKLGMTATLVATSKRPGSFALVPLAAITQKGDQTAVWVVNPGGEGLQLRQVTVAAYAREGAVVTSGLADGDKVVTAGVQKLDPDRKVSIWLEPQR
jgi:RND family efflux transporter MFP subunit